MFSETALAGQRTALVERSVIFGDRAAYLGLFARQPDEPRVRGPYLAWNLEPSQVDVQRILLPEGTLAFDLRAEAGTLSVLSPTP